MKHISIIGGGIAGLSLGIGLRISGVPVTVFEAGSYPRHRVCGEFISGRGLEFLDQFGLSKRLNRAGAVPARTGKIFLGGVASPLRVFPQAACCLSRYALDAVLAEEFQARGGKLVANVKQTAVSQEGWVTAAGRIARRSVGGWKWYGLKVHAAGVKLEADLELHAVENGYVGLCNLGGSLVNVCGLFRRPARGAGTAKPWQEELRGAPKSALGRRLAGSTFVEDSFCSVAGLSYQRQPRALGIAIGDALSMIPPATGNGMSLAIESAWLALDPLVAYSTERASWTEAGLNFQHACETEFASRLTWARLLHSFMISPSLRFSIGGFLLKSGLIWDFMFRRTRGHDFNFYPIASSGSLSAK